MPAGRSGPPFAALSSLTGDGLPASSALRKTRRNARFAAACEAVTPAKQARLIAAAEAWLQSAPSEKQPRFDVIEVYGEEGAAAPRIRQIENAFGG